MADLKPCPFCNARAEFERKGDARRSTIIRCTFCGVTLETAEEWNHGEDWNRRPAEERLQEENFALAAGQCQKGYSDEGGNYRCGHQDEIERLTEVLRQIGLRYGPTITLDQCAELARKTIGV